MFNKLLKRSGNEGFDFESDLLRSVKEYMYEKEELEKSVRLGLT